jgi:ABC-type lipoprotein release transport system permease subunit
MLSKTLVLVRIALANIFSSLLNVFIGLVLLFGAALLVIGGSLFTTLDGSLSRSIVDSITGHLQVYGSHSKDPLEIYGKVDGSDSNLAPIEDFKGLKTKLLTVPNVARVVPMGGATALLSSANAVDVTLEKLRALYRDQENPQKKLAEAAFTAQLASSKAHVQNIVSVLARDIDRAQELAAANSEELITSREAVKKASSPEFWDSFDADPLGHLEFLENRLAPLVADSDLLFIRCLGTDLDAYQSTFSRMSIVQGGKVPSGHRGVLLPRFFYEEMLKLKNARRLDKIRDAREAGRKLSDSSDKELQRWVKENQSQTREIVLQLDGLATTAAIGKLQALLHSQQADLATLLSGFFTVTDDNFDERYKFFYAELAPQLSLYRVRVGDELTLRSFGRSGSLETATVKVYGIFEMQGLEKSPLAGANALVDIVTFRDLYGFLTAERKAELDAMKASTGARQVSRDDAEAALFGADSGDMVEEVKAATIDDAVASRQVKRKADTFDLAELDQGMVLNAAILLKDGSRLAQLQAAQDVERLLGEERSKPDAARLTAATTLLASNRLPTTVTMALREATTLEQARADGKNPLTDATLLALQQALKAERASLSSEDAAVIDALLEAARPKVWVVGWGTAAGFLGKFIDFFRGLLAAVVLAFAFIALIVVTIGMTIATLQRTSTIGTMRAIGAQRSFVVAMVFIETVVLALTFGIAGAGVGAAVVTWMHSAGIPAFRDELYFFFSGPVLRPELTASGLALSVGVTLVVSVVAVLFPTWLATRIAPVTAMQSAE